MSLKPILAEFFTTINFASYRKSLALLTYKLPSLRYGKNIEAYEEELLTYLNIPDSKIQSLYNGRTALYQALKMLELSEKDEVIVSGYTCVSVSNAVIQSGAKIIYSDISKTNLGLDLKKLEKHITKNTKVIVVQHTFGRAANINSIIKLAKANNIIVIEDCAHSLGSKIGDKHLGTFGDIAIFSTSRDKVISSISGGFLVINNPDLIVKINNILPSLKMPGRGLTIRNLLYNVIGYESFLTYNFLKIGKGLIYFSRKFGLITNIITKSEKNCKYKKLNMILPNSLASLGQRELEILDFTQNHRISLAEYYDESIHNPLVKPLFKNLKSQTNNYFRYPIIVDCKETKCKLFKHLKAHGIIAGKSWSGTNIVPVGSNLENAGYTKGSCKVSEDISKRILLLPNHYLISVKNAEKIIKLINNFKA